MSDTDPRFPIGRAQIEFHLDPARREELISAIETTPERLREALAGIHEEEWDQPYRDGGWTVRQVVHHLADSHINSYVRFKLAVTEDVPTIKPYDEAAWAELPDVAGTPPEVSIKLLEAIHARLTSLLRSLPEEAFAREAFHPERNRNITIDTLLTIYGWHGPHHIAHIRQARERRRAAAV